MRFGQYQPQGVAQSMIAVVVVGCRVTHSSFPTLFPLHSHSYSAPWQG